MGQDPIRRDLLPDDDSVMFGIMIVTNDTDIELGLSLAQGETEVASQTVFLEMDPTLPQVSQVRFVYRVRK